MASINIDDSLKKYEYDTHRVCSPTETLKRLLEIKKNTGIIEFNKLKVTRIDRYDILGLPVFAVFPNYVSKPFGKPVHWGKGFTESQALTSGLMEFIERFSSSAIDNSRLIKGSHNSLPESLSLWDFVPTNRIRREFTKEEADNASLYWVDGFSLTTGKKVLVPINLSYFSGKNDVLTGSSDTNGLAAGNTLEEAILHGICEVVERHLFEVVSRNNLDCPLIDQSTIDDPLIIQLITLFASKGFELYLSDYTHNLGIPTICAIAYNENNSKPAIIATGTHPDKRIATIRALTEIIQYRASSLYKEYSNPMFKAPRNLPDFVKMQILQKSNSILKSYADVNSISKKTIREEISIVKNLLAEKGFDILVVDLTRKDMGIPVVRVLVKGMQPAIYEGDILNLMEDHARVSPHLNIFNSHISQLKQNRPDSFSVLTEKNT